MIARTEITGVVLAGGRGSRMGGVDKGLQLHEGEALAQRALRRLAPQVGPLGVSANRNLEVYAGFGVPVWTDTLGGFAGPLAGLLAALAQCRTPWLLSVPCDAPDFPADLAQRLGDAVAEADAQLALAVTETETGTQPQPVFCLLRATLRHSLQHFADDGGRKLGLWAAQQGALQVRFPQPADFFNANTLEELRSLQPR